MEENKPRILQKKTTYTIDYPAAIEFANKQMDVFWHPEEIMVEKDIQDLKVNFTEAERHGTITTLKLFTAYEVRLGEEYWLNKVFYRFRRPDIQRMASCFSFYELNIHSPFYSRLNEALGLATDEFYESYTKDPILKERMDFIEKLVVEPSLPVSIAAFSMVEGAVLYSAFAFLKHFQANGKNKLVNVTAGINYSARDEAIHALGGAWLYKTLVDELKVSEKELKVIKSKIIALARTIEEHENRIIDMVFEKGSMEGITKEDLKTFVRSRINICLSNLGIEGIYEIAKNPIADWFYKNITGTLFHDFFQKVGNSYKRTWSEKSFVWGQVSE